jgi:hypothetical protein
MVKIGKTLIISNKLNYTLITIIVVALVALIAYAATGDYPNPGHPASEVGSGTFHGVAGDSWLFPGNVGIEGVGDFGSMYQATIGDDVNSRAGYFNNGIDYVTLANGMYSIEAMGDVNIQGYMGVAGDIIQPLGITALGTNAVDNEAQLFVTNTNGGTIYSLKVEGNSYFNGNINASGTICDVNGCIGSGSAPAAATTGSGWTDLNLSDTTTKFNASCMYRMGTAVGKANYIFGVTEDWLLMEGIWASGLPDGPDQVFAKIDYDDKSDYYLVYEDDHNAGSHRVHANDPVTPVAFIQENCGGTGSVTSSGSGTPLEGLTFVPVSKHLITITPVVIQHTDVTTPVELDLTQGGNITIPTGATHAVVRAWFDLNGVVSNGIASLYLDDLTGTWNDVDNFVARVDGNQPASDLEQQNSGFRTISIDSTGKVRYGIEPLASQAGTGTYGARFYLDGFYIQENGGTATGAGWVDVPFTDVDKFDTECKYRVTTNTVDGWNYATAIISEFLLLHGGNPTQNSYIDYLDKDDVYHGSANDHAAVLTLPRSSNVYTEMQKNCDVSGGAATSDEISFHVTKTAQQNTLASRQTALTWQTEEFDYGSGFDLTNNAFVAPENGRYMFVAQAGVLNYRDDEAFALHIRKNGILQAHSHKASITGDVGTSHNTVLLNEVLDLVAGDMVNVSIGGDKAITVRSETHFTYFSGFKIGSLSSAGSGWVNVSLLDATPFDIDCRYRVKSTALNSWNYAMVVFEDWIMVIGIPTTNAYFVPYNDKNDIIWSDFGFTGGMALATIIANQDGRHTDRLQTVQKNCDE